MLAPCVFPLLPVIVGGSISNDEQAWRRPLVVTLSLAASVTLFTLILKASTALLGVPSQTWKLISGGIVIILGLAYIFPNLWTKIMHKTGLEKKTQAGFSQSTQKKGLVGEILTGMSLGPVFSSCSPMYGVLLATVLPANFLVGVANIISYSLGLAVIMFFIAILGQRATKNLKWAASPNGNFRKVLGVIFLLIGVAIIFGLDKTFEAWIIDQGYFGALELEQQLSDKACELSDSC